MITTNTLNKGLSQDIHPKFQPEGSYRYALNAVLETNDGNIGAISNELGNTYCATNWPIDKTLIGHSLTDTDDIVVFFYHSDPVRPEHEIGIYDPVNCEYTTLCIDKFLNFSIDHPINTLFRVRNGCDKMVYFTDNYNKYRVINVSDTSHWVEPTLKTLLTGSIIDFTRPFVVPKVISNLTTTDDVIIDGAGKLEYGSYIFYFRYLDADLNPTFEWLPLTHYIKIGTGLQTNSDTSLLHGASNVLSSPYYNSASTKAIKIRLAQLDQDHPFFQIAVVKRTSDSGAYSGVDLLYPQPIDNVFTSEFVYTGYEDNILDQINVDEVLVPKQPIDMVAAHAIDDRRLYLAGLKGPDKDADPESVYAALYPPKQYYRYQSYASKVKLRYIATKTEDRQAKAGLNNAYGETLLPDEVYAIGIVYVHSDGRKSPVFHIPGRPADIDMTGHTSPVVSTHTNWDTDDITGDENIFDNTKTKRWQVYSTATLQTSFAGLTEFTGYLGYYENSATYPHMPICDEEDETLYWGEDWDGNPIIPGETKIRHHRMPAEWLYKDTAIDNDYAAFPQYTYKLLVDEIEAPDPSVIGFYIVVADRADNKTILDRGLLRSMYWHNTDEVFAHTYLDWDSLVNLHPNGETKAKWNYYTLTTPTTVYDSKHLGGDYLSIAKKVQTSTTNKTLINPAGTTSVSVDEFDVNVAVDSRIYEYTKYKRPDRYNYQILGSELLRKTTLGKTTVLPTTSNSYYTQSTVQDRLENRSMNHDVAYLELNTYLKDFDSLTINCGSNGCSPTEPGIDTFHFVATTKANREVYTNLFNLQYKQLHPSWLDVNFSAAQVIHGGDHFVPYFDAVEMFYNNGSPIASLTSTPLIYDKNLEFRHYSTADRGKYTWYRYQGGYDHKPFARHIGFKYYEITASQGQFYPEHYNLSDKYNYQLPDGLHLPIPFNYDICKDCLEDMPYRIFYSEQDTEEQSEDYLRNIKVNNYANTLGEYGPITDLFTVRNRMYLATENTLLHLPTRPQSIQSNEATIEIGTGEVLSLPFSNISETAYPIGGCASFKHRSINEFGAVYVDPRSQRVFIISDQLSDISVNGMRNFWKENGAISYLDQFYRLTGQPYPHVHPTNPVGVGYNVVYDPRYSRVIFHKKDYEFLGSKLELGVNVETPNTVWFDGTNYYYNTFSLGTVQIDLNNSSFFKNKSFTLSYSFITNSWVSFHTYFPSYMMNNHDTFYTNGPWKHNEGNYQTYYNNKFPHIVDLIIPQHGLDGKLTKNIQYTSTTELYNPTLEAFAKVPNVTYDGLIAYNTDQSSGYQPIIFKQNAFQQDQQGSVLVDYVDDKYRLNDLRDLTITSNQPVWTNRWQYLLNTPYIDKVPNPTNINQFSSFFSQRRFRDHYLGLRFFFNPDNNYRISTDIVSTLFANRNR